MERERILLGKKTQKLLLHQEYWYIYCWCCMTLLHVLCCSLCLLDTVGEITFTLLE